MGEIRREAEIEPFIAEEAGDDVFEALNRFRNLVSGERLPDDPPETVERTRALFLTKPDFVDPYRWAAWDRSEERAEIVAYGRTAIFHTEDNRHLLNFNVDVLPLYRRRR